jgi:hypothetical protein
LIGPGLIASGIYVQTSGFPGVKKIFDCLLYIFAIHENYFYWYFAGMIVGFEKTANGKSSMRKGRAF